MKIYLAGLMHSGGRYDPSGYDVAVPNPYIGMSQFYGHDKPTVRRWLKGEIAIPPIDVAAATTGGLRYPYLLESYYYCGKDTKFVPAMREARASFFLDSGAFSSFTLDHVSIDIEQYAAYCRDNADVYHMISNLDEIGAGKEQVSYDNLKRLEALGVKASPVHHVRDDDRWLVRYMDEGYDPIFIGGMVPESIPWLRERLDQIFTRYIMSRGKPRVGLHGFGLSSMDLVLRYPWYSVDATGWVMVSAFGQVFMDLPGAQGYRDFRLTLSNESPRAEKLDSHLDTFAPIVRRRIVERFNEFGYEVDDLKSMYGWRRLWNIEYFRRVMTRPDPVFQGGQQTLFT